MVNRGRGSYAECVPTIPPRRSHRPGSRRREDDTQRIGPSSSVHPRVELEPRPRVAMPALLVSSVDRGTLLRLGMLFRGLAEVVPVHQEQELVRAMLKSARCSLLVDGIAPSLPVDTIALALARFPVGAPVMVFGADRGLQTSLTRFAGTDRWRYLAAGTGLDEVEDWFWATHGRP